MIYIVKKEIYWRGFSTVLACSGVITISRIMPWSCKLETNYKFFLQVKDQCLNTTCTSSGSRTLSYFPIFYYNTVSFSLSLDKVASYRSQPYWIGLNDHEHEGKFVWLDESYEVRERH